MALNPSSFLYQHDTRSGVASFPAANVKKSPTSYSRSGLEDVRENVNLWSGRRELNPRRQPWQGCTLPLSYSRVRATHFIYPECCFRSTLN